MFLVLIKVESDLGIGKRTSPGTPETVRDIDLAELITKAMKMNEKSINNSEEAEASYKDLSNGDTDNVDGQLTMARSAPL